MDPISGAMVMDAFNPRIREADVNRSLSGDPPGLPSKFQDNLEYTEKHCLKKPKPPKQPNKQKTQTKSTSQKRILLSSYFWFLNSIVAKPKAASRGPVQL